ncbi:glycosyltransferase family protein [Piscinibacter sakaiensis]|uniref:glycosyltransferase family protein n=1 Tax=Piscinibacter sakaiensis TaxID=1547922 RepID=UPI003AAD3C46
MRVFQMAGFGPFYLSETDTGRTEYSSFNARRSALLDDRYEATHILEPVYNSSPDIFFTVSDDLKLQMQWAREKGMKSKDLTQILLAQIEEFNPDIIYNLDPILFPSSFIKRLPACVKKTLAWRAGPIAGADLSAYDVILSNFESLNSRWRQLGLRTAEFFPSWDPAMEIYAENAARPIDVFFAGSYARTTGHDDRVEVLDQVATLSERYFVDLRVRAKRWGRLADQFVLRWIPAPIFLPKNIRRLAKHAIYGRDMYTAISSSKVIVNPSTSIVGDYRGNMRCWEALGCGACMLATKGHYPEGFVSGETYEEYGDSNDARRKLEGLLVDDARRIYIASRGAKMVKERWSKGRQWKDFQAIVSSL